MKRKLLVCALALSMCSVPVYAEDAATPESVLQGMKEYSANAASQAASMTMNLDAALKVTSEDAPETSIPLTMDGTFDMKTIQDPMQVGMNGSFKISVLGQTQEQGMEMYMTMSEEGQADSYTKVTIDGTEAEWQHTIMDMNEVFRSLGVSDMKELSSMELDDILGKELDWNLTEADDTYTMDTQISFSDLMPVIESSMKAADETAEMTDEEMEMVESILGEFKMNVSYVVAKETYATKSAHIDFNDSSMTMINEMLASAMSSALDSEEGSSSEMAIELTDFSIDMTFSEEAVDSIEIPEEALSAEAIDVEDLAEEAAAMAEDAAETEDTTEAAE